jgi:hypothetical protein
MLSSSGSPAKYEPGPCWLGDSRAPSDQKSPNPKGKQEIEKRKGKDEKKKESEENGQGH